MTGDRLASLIARQLTGELGPEEVQELVDWGNELKLHRDFLDRFADDSVIENELRTWQKIDPADGYTRWIQYNWERRRRRILRIGGWSAAASLLIAIAIGGVIRTVKPAVHNTNGVGIAVAKTVMPGRNTATLTLANGQQLLLDSVANGQLGVQGNSRVVKADSTSLAYQSSGNSSVAVEYNVLTTPRAGQFQLTLTDGSRVWLNNVSSLRYPTSFKGKDRRVELTGEAYFEIARDARKPFIVQVKDASIQVLGTSFNVMAYPDESGSQTTLLTGAVQVKAGTGEVDLHPDEQAQVTSSGELKLSKDVASADIVSWKDGFFYFGRASFAAVMRQLARWYDVDVVYEGKIPDMEFGGKVDRTLPLNDLLKFLDKNQIHFRLEGRKLIVLPN